MANTHVRETAFPGHREGNAGADPAGKNPAGKNPAGAIPADGNITVGGISARVLAARVGSTPFFAYDRERITRRVADVRAALPRDVELSYAVKANPMPAVLHHMAALVDGFDVASGGELRHALDTPVPPERVSFAGPGKTTAELTQAVAAGVTVELESRNELARVRDVAERLGLRARVALRVNPDFTVKGAGMRLGGGAQQFGIDAERVPEVLAELAAAGLDFLGFHVFAGSQNLRADSVSEAQRRTVDLALRLAEAAPGPLRYLNLGGGFGIPYAPRDQPLDLAEVGENLAELMATRVRPQLPDARVVIELGRYLVGEAGVYVTRVIDRKESRGTTFLVVDGGLHHQLAASGNFGQVIRRNYPLAVADRATDRATTAGRAAADREAAPETVTVVGCLCTPLDLLGDRVDLPRAEIGDLIAIFQAGAYGLTASPTAFLGHPAPVEVLV
ncbi:pyridoxal-dependent decarboxylase, exosortase A system-associated [Streptomyces sp. PT12]|uniref:pyridoxal-dependent decarboxylase, exosortase A system-associated n=1 Tax=Streptomyces sp. PT12 TaxID=1510197 RepID=UPI000DE4790B|nr:pyridoxal-dependent decarboxylase, exosortase A system-associated [Streptomyces sp. PT12]RBM20490.1 pyridoxal-dependent decarboxylase, exosortase A system-associated [Streptomyces sp. PT12]